jgi:hypothetical protein
MKKQYIEPQTEIVEVEYRGMLAYSIGDPAEEPAHGRELDDLFLVD